METKEYIVILHNHTDLDDFYTDMEQQGHREYVPSRAVELVRRRPMSRSTHYQLTDTEVEALKQDPRVLNIHQPYYDLGMKIVPCVTQESNYWTKGYGPSTPGNPEVNWGLLRCVEGKKRANWGRDGILQVSGTIDLPNTGQHVDVVIADGHILPGHPEFAKNPNGTGGSRVNQYNWFKHNLEVLGSRGRRTVDGVTSFVDEYEYDFTETGETYNNHGAQTAGLAVGNTHGFARDANIYNINPYADKQSTRITINGYICDIYTVINFIEAFHKNKLRNPATGRRNPTIVNMSFLAAYPRWGSRAEGKGSIQYGKRLITPNPGPDWSDEQLRKVGWSGYYYQRDDSMDQDIISAMAAGVIFVGASGNDRMYVDRPGNDLYDSALIESGSGNKTYYMRGASPGAAPGVICVGAVDNTVEERNASYSSKGPRLDIYAPAESTFSARNTSPYLNYPSTEYATTPPPGGPTCTFDTYPRSVNEGASITFTINTTGFASGTQLNWVSDRIIPARGLADGPDFGRTTGSIGIDGDGRGTFIVPIQADEWTEGAETFVVRIYKTFALDGYYASTDPITIVDTSTGNATPRFVDSRNTDYYKYIFNGTSAAAPHVTGVIACALETYPNMTAAQALSYIQTYADRGLLTDIPFNADYEADEWQKKTDDGSTINVWRLFNGPNMYLRYQSNTRPNQVQPEIGHQLRPVTGAVYPRTRVKRT
jgi:hypothetical protein